VSRLAGDEAGDVRGEEAVLLELTDDGEQLLFSLPSSWTRALAGSGPDQLRAAAVAFRHDPMNCINGEPDVLTTDESVADGIASLAGLARRAQQTGRELFCWVCV